MGNIAEKLKEITGDKSLSSHSKREKLEQLLDPTLDPYQKIALNIELAYIFKDIGNLTKSKEIFMEALSSATQHVFILFEGEIQAGLARVVMDLGELDSAQIYYEKSIDIFSHLNNHSRVASIRMNYAMLFYLKGEFDRAIHAYNDILAYSKDHPDFDVKNAFSMLGIIHHQKGQLDLALKYFKQAAAAAWDLEDYNNYCLSQNNAAETLALLGDFREAENRYLSAIKTAEEHHLDRILANINLSYSQMLIEIGDIVAANTYLQEGLKNIDLVNTYDKISAKISYGNLLSIMGQYESALGQFQEGYQMAEMSKIKEPLIDLLVLMAENNHILENSEQAYDDLIQAEELAHRFKSKAGQTKCLIQRAQLAMSNLNLGETQLILLDAQRLATKIDNVALHFKILLLLAELNLMKALNKKEAQIFIESAQKYINEAVRLAKSKNLIVKHIQALLVQGTIMLINNPKNSELCYSFALKMAQEYGIRAYIQKAHEKLTLLTNQQKSSLAPSSPTQQFVKNLVGELSETLRPEIKGKLEEVDLESLFYVAYKVDEMMGPIVYQTLHIDPEDPQYFKQLIMGGALFSSALGQGSSYHQGLFGPFPFGEGSLRSLVYSQIIADTSQIQERNAGTVFVLICLIYRQKYARFFYNREEIEEIFHKYLSLVNEIGDLTVPFLEKIHTAIVEKMLELSI